MIHDPIITPRDVRPASLRVADALRSKRKRWHDKGEDHSLCLPRSCDQAPNPLPPPDVAVTRRVMESIPTAAPDVATLAADDVLGRLMVEFQRCADRLDGIDRVLTGQDDRWLQLLPDTPDGRQLRIVMTGVLAEGRQQQMALKSLASEIRAAAPTGAASVEEADPLAAIADAVAQKRRQRAAWVAGAEV